MGYWLDLDEQPEGRLREELARREELQTKGLCDYCGGSPALPPCKEEGRHAAPLKASSTASPGADEDSNFCCRGACCAPGSWCCARAGEHTH